MKITEQVKIIETRIAPFNTVLEKMQHITEFFGPDPEFKKLAIDQVVAKLIQREGP